jgi:hypothetical protein
MSGEGRRARSEKGAGWRGQIELSEDLVRQSAGCRRQRQGRRRGRQQCTGKMDERADRAIVVSSPGNMMGVATRRLLRVAVVRNDAGRRMPGERTEMHVPKGERELKGQRK